LQRTVKSQQEAAQRQLEEFRQAILNATNDQHTTKLIMWLREDLPNQPNRYSSYAPRYSTIGFYEPTPKFPVYNTRCSEKLDEICATPKLALVAFLAALSFSEQQMRRVGLVGLRHLRQSEGISPILDALRACNDLKAEVSEALIELSAVSSVRGPNSFFAIFEKLLMMPYTDIDNEEKHSLLRSLLNVATERLDDFGEEDYQIIFASLNEFSDSLIVSGQTALRHLGEDFKREIAKIQVVVIGLKKQRERRNKDAWDDEQYKRNWRYTEHEWKKQNGAKESACKGIDYYRILQVDPLAEPEVITAAYRRLAAKYHPDISKAPDATRKMQQLNEAYDVLNDPEKRKRYDARRR
jgi:DnaJ-domain-containing protein 1